MTRRVNPDPSRTPARRLPAATEAPRPDRVADALPGVVFRLAMTPAGALQVRFAGSGARELFDVEADELMGGFAQILGSVHAEDADALLTSLHESAAELSAWDWSGRAFAADGALKYLRGLAQPVREADGTTTWDGVLLDQTEAAWEHALESAMRRRLQLIVEHLPAASVTLYDRDLRLCLCEGQLFADLDLSPMLGRPLPAFVGPETLKLVLPGLEAALAGETAAPVVLESDTRGRTLAVNFAPYRLSDGRIDGALVHWQDISELRQAERARREAEEVLRRGFDDAPIGMALVSLDGRWLRVNHALCETIGYSSEELLELTFHDVTHNDDLNEDVELVAQMLAGEIRSYQLEKRYRHQDGHLVWARLSVSLARDEQDRPLYFVSQVEDISERKHAEQELAQARAEIDRFFALSLDLMTIANADGYFVRINPAFESILGYTSEELTGRPCMDFVHPDDVAATEDAFRRQTGGSQVLAFENRYRCRDGSYRWLLWSATVLDDGYVYATARDVTERREMEERLRESREQALSASRLKSEFVANMSHEIRTPLNGVLSMSELLLGTELSDEQLEYAQVNATSAQALMRVIDDILDFSKIEAGKLEIVRDDFEIKSLIADVCGIVGPKAREKLLELTYAVAPSVPAILNGDGGRMRQVLLNLVSNAVKFTSAGGVSVGVDVISRSLDGLRVRIEVTDTGIGIEPDQLVKVFAPFAQADATTTRRYGGTGLGLSIARQLIELMDGDIGLTSTPGQGSTFWFELVCEPGQAAELQPTARDLTGTRVLIVDPDAASRMALERQTASWGMIPASAECAAAALEHLHRAVRNGGPFELALIDHVPGRLDGRALAGEMESSPRLRSTRRVMLTSEAGMQTGDGVESVLVKPARPSRLYDHLVRAVNAARRAAPARPRRASASGPGGPGRRVLVAEDNEINQFAAIRMLQKLGYVAEVAEDGRQAVQMAQRGRYTAIFMDCQMPELDGYEATSAIRLHEGEGAHTPIIAMTANTMSGDRERCLAAGMDDYLAKPLGLESLAAVCERWLRAEAPVAALVDTPVAVAAGLFDCAVLAEFASPVQIAGLLSLFVTQLHDGMVELREAISARDPEAAARIAHRLKGSAATVGAGAVADLMHAIARDTRTGMIPSATRLARAQATTTATIDAIGAHLGAADTASVTAAATRW